MPSHSWPYLHHIKIGGALLRQASELSITYRSIEVRLALVQRWRTIRSRHRFLTELSVIEMFNVHRPILISKAAQENR